MPITKNKPAVDLSGKTVLVIGQPKSGKSSLLAEVPNAVFLANERGLDELEVTKWESADGRYVISSWQEQMDATAEVIKSGAKTIIIDTLDNLVFLADRYICDAYKVKHKNEGVLGYGKGGDIILMLIRDYLHRVISRNVGVYLISHTSVEERETRAGTIKCTVPSIPEKLRPSLLAIMDITLFLDMEIVPGSQREVRRVLRTKPDPTYEAGDRTGRLPETLPCNWGAVVEAYQRGQEPKKP